jgi:hypothetical protein
MEAEEEITEVAVAAAVFINAAEVLLMAVVLAVLVAQFVLCGPAVNDHFHQLVQVAHNEFRTLH